MRWNAAILLVSSLTLGLAIGCNRPQKDVAQTGSGVGPEALYSQPGYEESGEEYVAYGPDLTVTAPEPSYSDPYVPESPGGSASSYHTVAKGDTLYAIARTYYGDQRRWKDVYAANRADIKDPNYIRVGQQLLIP